MVHIMDAWNLFLAVTSATVDSILFWI